MKFCFVHAADLHLNTPFEGITTVSPEVAEKLRDASLDAFDSLIEFTIDKKAKFLLLAGDIYEGPERGVRAQLRFKAGLEKLSSEGIQTFIVHGNHDPLLKGGWSAIRQWPEGTKIFGCNEVETVKVMEGNTVLATIYGISYEKREVKKNLAKSINRQKWTGLHIGLLHCNVGGSKDHEPYSPCSMQDLLDSNMDYWALGHIHKRQELNKDPWIEYPGNLQGHSTKPSEREPKGALLVEVNGKTIEDEGVIFEQLDRIRFVEVEIDISTIEGIDSLSRLLIEEAYVLRKHNKDRGLIIRTILRGRGELHRELSHPDAAEGILEDLRDNFESRHPFIWWESIRDETKAALDPLKLKLRKDFSAELISLVENLQKKDPLGFDEFIKTHLEKPIFKAKLSLREFELRDEEIPKIIEQAEYLALDLLEEKK